MDNIPQGFNSEGNSIYDEPIRDEDYGMDFDRDALPEDIATGKEANTDIKHGLDGPQKTNIEEIRELVAKALKNGNYEDRCLTDYEEFLLNQIMGKIELEVSRARVEVLKEMLNA